MREGRARRAAAAAFMLFFLRLSSPCPLLFAERVRATERRAPVGLRVSFPFFHAVAVRVRAAAERGAAVCRSSAPAVGFAHKGAAMCRGSRQPAGKELGN